MTKIWMVLGLAWGTMAWAIPTGLVNLDGDAVKGNGGKEKELLVFWATWCNECRDKLSGELVELDKRKDLTVLTVNTDEDVRRAADYIQRNNVTLPVLRDPDRRLQKKLAVYSVPFWALYSGNEVIASDMGYDRKKILEALRD